MLPSFHPKSYQDVKKTLAWYASIMFLLFGLVFYYYFLPNNYHNFLSERAGRLLSFGIISILLIFIGWLLMFIFEIHDKVYDKYIIQWRQKYDLYYLIPKLVRPFTDKLDQKFFKEVRKCKDEFMKVYYHFVGDLEHKDKIDENLIVRFYEVVVKYWITQINEVILFFLFIISLILYPIYNNLGVSMNKIVLLNYAIAFLFLINSCFIRITREQVRQKTDDEIDEIHNSFSKELENQIADFHNKNNLRYKHGK